MTTPSTDKKPFQIVVGFDLSELGERVIEEALDIVRHRTPAELHVITVASGADDRINLPGETVDTTDAAAREAVRLRVARVVDEDQRRHGAVGLDRIAVYVVASTPTREPGRTISDLASALDANLIVVGTHGRTGVDRLILGSVASQVVRHATTNVYVVQPADFFHGKKVPAIERPLAPGDHHLKPFEHRRTFHYVDKVSAWTSRTMPVS